MTTRDPCQYICTAALEIIQFLMVEVLTIKHKQWSQRGQSNVPRGSLTECEDTTVPSGQAWSCCFCDPPFFHYRTCIAASPTLGYARTTTTARPGSHTFQPQSDLHIPLFLSPALYIKSARMINYHEPQEIPQISTALETLALRVDNVTKPSSCSCQSFVLLCRLPVETVCRVLL